MNETKDLQAQAKLKLKSRKNQFNPGRTPLSEYFRLIGCGFTSFCITIAFAAIAIAVFPLTRELKEMPKSIQWPLLEGFSSLVTLALVVGGVVFVFLEHLFSRRQERREIALAGFDVYKVVFDALMNPTDTASRRWIMQNMSVLDPLPRRQENENHSDYMNRLDIWAEPHKRKIFAKPAHEQDEALPGNVHIKQVLNTLDFIGFVAQNYWSMDNEMVEWLSAPIAKVWDRLGPYIEYEATRRNEKDYYIFAREFSDYCLLWWKAHYPDPQIVKDAL